MTDTKTLVKTFERAKKIVLKSYQPNHDGSDVEVFSDEAAHNIAKHDYGDYIEQAIKQLKKHDAIKKDLKTIFIIKMRNAPQDFGLGYGRMKEYHRRFVSEIAPILESTPVRS